MAANGGSDFHYVEDAGLDIEEAQDVARRAMTPNRVVSEELEMPLTAIPESDDDDVILLVPQHRTPSDAANAPAKQSGFSFTPFGAAAGRRSPTLMPTGLPGAGAGADAEAPFEPQHDRPDSPSLLPRSASPGLPPRPASPGLLSSSGSGALPRTGSWGAATPTTSDSASGALPRSSSPSLARSGSSSYLNPEPYEPPAPDPFALARDDEDGRLPALPAAAAIPGAGSMYRPPSAEAMEYLSATSGSLPLLETASAQPDAPPAANTAAVDAVPAAAPPPEAAAPEATTAEGGGAVEGPDAAASADVQAAPLAPAAEEAGSAEGTGAAEGAAASAPAGMPAALPAPATDGPDAAEGVAAAASADAPKSAAKARRLVPKLPIIPPTPPEDAFVGLPDDVLHGTGDQSPPPPPPPEDASSTVAEPAMSMREEPAAKGPETGPAAEAPEQAPAADTALGAEAKPAAADVEPPAPAAETPQSPPAPPANDAEEASFAPQTPEVSHTEALAPADERPAPADEAADQPAAAQTEADAGEQSQHNAVEASGMQPAEQAPLEYVSRDNQTPYMERKLRNLQAQDWEGSGGLGEDAKPVLTRSQKEREEDLQSWKHMDGQPISVSAAKAVQAVDHAPLGEDFKVHKSRLEQDVEAARQRERTPQPPSQQHLPSYMRPTANSATRNQSVSSPRAQSPAGGRHSGAPPTPPQGGLEAVMVRHQSALEAAKANSASSAYEPVKRAPPPSVPGLDELLADTGRIQRAREEAAQRHSELYRPVPKREAPKGPGLDEVLVVTKSQLELEKDAAAKAAGTAAAESPRPPPDSPADKARKQREAAAAEHIRRFRPAAPKSQESDSFGGKGLGEVMLKHKSALQRKKEEAEAAGANSPTAPLRSGSRSQMLAQRQGEQWGGRSLAELQKSHKSRLLREQEEWAERSGTKLVSSRKPIVHSRHVTSPGERPDAPSFMKDTMASTMKHIDMPEPPRTPGT